MHILGKVNIIEHKHTIILANSISHNIANYGIKKFIFAMSILALGPGGI